MTISWLQRYNLLIFDQIDSTNSEALRLVKANVTGDFIIVAREQTMGRGQRGRVWESISGNLHASILLESNLNLNRLKELSFLTAIALHKTIISFIKSLKTPKANIELKWPNDVLINGKKVAGILLESIRYNDKNYVIVGVGVNTHFYPKIPGMEITSLFSEGIILRQSDDFLSDFMINFHFYYKKWQTANNFANIKKEWLKNAYYLNKNITLNDGTQKVTGIFKGIDESGALCIGSENGEIRSFAAGDVSYG